MMEFTLEKYVAIATPYMNQKSQSNIKNTAHPYSASTWPILAATIPHRTDECDVCGLAVQHGLVRVDPQAGHLRQYVDNLDTRVDNITKI